MRSTSLFATTLSAGLLLAGAALAQATAPAAAPAPAPAASSAAAPKGDKVAISKACSSEADAKGLHGKARKKFRSQCRHDKMM